MEDLVSNRSVKKRVILSIAYFFIYSSNYSKSLKSISLNLPSCKWILLIKDSLLWLKKELSSSNFLFISGIVILPIFKFLTIILNTTYIHVNKFKLSIPLFYSIDLVSMIIYQDQLANSLSNFLSEAWLRISRWNLWRICTANSPLSHGMDIDKLHNETKIDKLHTHSSGIRVQEILYRSHAWNLLG